MRVYRLVVQNTLEQQILDRASFKLNIDAKIIQAGMFNNNASDEMRREMLVCFVIIFLLKNLNVFLKILCIGRIAAWGYNRETQWRWWIGHY